MTPAELNTFIEGKTEFIHDLEDLFTYNAWLSAALERQKRLPRLKALLNRKQTEQKYKTPEEAKEELQELISRLGGDPHG